MAAEDREQQTEREDKMASRIEEEVDGKKREAKAHLRDIGVDSLEDLNQEKLVELIGRVQQRQVSERVFLNILEFSGTTASQFKVALEKVVGAGETNNAARMENIRLSIEQFGKSLKDAETPEEREKIRDDMKGLVQESKNEADSQRSFLWKMFSALMVVVVFVVSLPLMFFSRREA